MLRGLNHITVTVSNLERSLKFYIGILGFKGHVKWATGAYLSLGDLWYCLILGNPSKIEDYSHLAFDVTETDLDEMAKMLHKSAVRQWKTNESEGRSIYILDPDGHQLEIHAGSLMSRLESLKSKPYKNMQWL